MKSVLLVILLYSSIVSLLGVSFEKSYPLYDLGDISDQTLLRTSEGDEYFFSITDGVLKVKQRVNDSDDFYDYILDPGIYSFKSVLELELAIYDGNREVLYLIAERDEYYDLVKLYIDQNSFNISVIQSFNTRISNLEVMNSHTDKIVLSYEQSDVIHICSITYSGLVSPYDVGIPGQYKKLYSYYNLHELNDVIQSFYFTYADGIYNLWYLEINESDLMTQYVKTVTSDEVDTFLIDITTGIKCFYTKGEYKTYYRVIDKTCSFVTSTSEIDCGYYEINGVVIYCVKSNEDLISLDTLESTLDFSFRDNLTFYGTENRGDSGFYSTSHNTLMKNDQSKLDYQIIIMGNFLLSFSYDPLCIFTFYHLGEEGRDILHTETLDFSHSEIDPEFDVQNSYIKLNGTEYIVSLVTYKLYKNRKNVVRMGDYLLYQDDDGFYYLGVDL